MSKKGTSYSPTESPHRLSSQPSNGSPLPALSLHLLSSRPPEPLSQPSPHHIETNYLCICLHNSMCASRAGKLWVLFFSQVIKNKFALTRTDIISTRAQVGNSLKWNSENYKWFLWAFWWHNLLFKDSIVNRSFRRWYNLIALSLGLTF